MFWGGKALYGTYMLALPLAYSHHSVGRLLALWLAADAVTGWMLAYMFQARPPPRFLLGCAPSHQTERVPIHPLTEAGQFSLPLLFPITARAGCARGGRRGVSGPRPEDGQGADGVGGPPGVDDGGLLPREQVLAARLRGAQLPGERRAKRNARENP